MYYRRVNRGLSFTKPGVYAFGLVLLIGMTAVTTGINGLYVFLSAGLGGFIVSGLLSEKAMKSCSVRSIAGSMADEGASFPVQFTVENSSSWFSVFALQNFFMIEPPTGFSLISRRPDAFASVKLTRVAPGSVHSFEVSCQGMPRGVYGSVIAMQRTTFPFGILDKFKMMDVSASLMIAPRLDLDVLEHMRAVVRQKQQALEADREFFSHRAYVARDSLKHVDWKKSAGRPSRDWVVKQYKAPSASSPLCLDAPWAHAVALATASEYEAYLSHIRTALKALEESQLGYVLDFGEGLCLKGYDLCLAALASAPQFIDRNQCIKAVANAQLTGRETRFAVRDGRGSWIDSTAGAQGDEASHARG